MITGNETLRRAKALLLLRQFAPCAGCSSPQLLRFPTVRFELRCLFRCQLKFLFSRTLSCCAEGPLLLLVLFCGNRNLHLLCIGWAGAFMCDLFVFAKVSAASPLACRQQLSANFFRGVIFPQRFSLIVFNGVAVVQIQRLSALRHGLRLGQWGALVSNAKEVCPWM